MKRILILLISSLLASTLYAQTTITADRVVTKSVYVNGSWIEGVYKDGAPVGDRTIPTTKSVKELSKDTIFIFVSGQSNANGVNYGDYDTASNPKVLAWHTINRDFEIMRVGNGTQGVYRPAQLQGNLTWRNSVNFSFYLAKRLQEKTGKVIKVMNLSWNGEVIDNWFGDSSKNFSYIKSELALAGNPKVDYFLWCQGESDNAMSDTAYKRRVDTLQAQLDRLPSWSKATPFIFVTPSEVTSSSQHHIVNIQRAIAASSFYDRRYLLCDASQFSGVDIYHFTAYSHYLIGNKLIELIYNKPSFSYYLKTSPSEIALMVDDIPNIGKGIVVRDTVNAKIQIMGSSQQFGEIVGMQSPTNNYLPYFKNGVLVNSGVSQNYDSTFINKIVSNNISVTGGGWTNRLELNKYSFGVPLMFLTLNGKNLMFYGWNGDLVVQANADAGKYLKLVEYTGDGVQLGKGSASATLTASRFSIAGAVFNIPVSTAPSSSSDASGVEGDLTRDASGNIYLKTASGWLKFTGVSF